MKSRIILGVAVAGALAATAFVAAPASAQSSSFTNPLASTSADDFPITSVDVSYTNASLVVVSHLQGNAAGGFENFLVVSPQPTYGFMNANGLEFNLESADGTALTDGSVDVSANGTSTTNPVPAGTTAVMDSTGSTLTVTIPSSAIPYTTGIYIAEDIETSTGSSVAGAAYGGSSVTGFGPITRDATATTTTLSLSSASQVHASTPAVALVSVSPINAVGRVQILEGATVIASGAVTNGSAFVPLPASLASGTHSLVAQFVPDSALNFAASSSAVATFKVISSAKSTKTTAKLSKTSQHFKSKSTIKVTVTVAKKRAGKIAFYDGKKKLKSVKLKKGKATYSLPKTLKKGKHTIKALYVPKDVEAFKASSKTFKIKVLS